MKRGLFIKYIVAIIFFSNTAWGLQCQTCSWEKNGAQSQPNIDCITGNNVPLINCSYSDSFNPYCKTTITLLDGLTTSVNKECTVNTITETEVLDTKCKTVYTAENYNDNIATTTCSYGCNTDGCNDDVIDFVKLCPYSCGPNGECDYLKGTCECREGFTSANCSVGAAPPVQTFRSCVQCDIDVEDCGAATQCESPSEQYCSSTQTFVYTQDDELVNSVISRGCTSEFVASDECFISTRTDNLLTTDIEYTCVSTCDTDGCNTNTPNGILESNEANSRPLECVVCSYNEDDSNDDCSTSTNRVFCPSSAKFCSSTVTYYISDKLDVNHRDEFVQPDYMLKSVTRSCSTNAVARQCTSRDTATKSLKEVSCQETCNANGCNIGWPARPKCSTCSSCINNPPEPISCGFPYEEFCAVYDRNRAVGLTSSANGYPTRSVRRGCTYKSIGNGCSSPGYGMGVIENCNISCTTDGCNLGEFSAATVVSSNPINLFLVCFFSIMLAILLDQ